MKTSFRSRGGLPHRASALLPEALLTWGTLEVRAERLLDLGDRKRMPLFRRGLHRPRFILRAAWVELAWPKTAARAWTGEVTSPAYYTVRVEPLDDNIAWSSPAWRQDRLPEPNVPGRVVCQ